jgi:hypothetical protein
VVGQVGSDHPVHLLALARLCLFGILCVAMHVSRSL